MKMRNTVLIVALMLGVAFVFNAPVALAKDMTAKDLVEKAKKNITMISLDDAKALFDKGGVVFLDCREPKEYKAGHIPGAINIPRGLLEFQIEGKISDKNANMVMYCKTGGRGCLACESIGEMGYKNVKNMEGGWMAWEKAGYPVD
ncbi:MAG TPA: rhodanese-like domain-containing protein [Desulfatiglandales bacterium]|nr:rhodanese-like domain-containing protein [Desulfatiglandales bacterium]